MGVCPQRQAREAAGQGKQNEVDEDAAVTESPLENRPRFQWTEVSGIAALFGSYELVKMLPSERDQNFLLRPTDRHDEDAQIVLKIHNPSDDISFVECQTFALERAAAKGARCQRLLRTLDSKEVVASLPSPHGTCQCRALSFLPGRMLADAAADTKCDQAALFGEVGAAVGSVTSALLDFSHPAATYDFDWDLRQCEQVIGARIAHVSSERRPLVEGCLARYRSDIKSLLPSLRLSIVHNDPNDYNLVVKADGTVGVLDFGDMVFSYTCADAAICMAYLLFNCPKEAPLAQSVLPFVSSFHKQCPLTEAEARALFGLAVMRVCTSVCMSSYQSQLEPDNEYLLISAKPAWALLERLASSEDEAQAPAVLCKACGF